MIKFTIFSELKILGVSEICHKIKDLWTCCWQCCKFVETLQISQCHVHVSK